MGIAMWSNGPNFAWSLRVVNLVFSAGGGDVWDGFEDDGGFGDDFSMPCSPPEAEEPEEHLVR